MKPDKFIIFYVIQGNEYPIEVNPNQPLKTSVQKSLKSAGIQGNINGWEVRTEGGTQLDVSQSILNLDLTANTKLFLSKGAGRGGMNS